MSLLIEWDGETYDVDPEEFTGLEAKLLEDHAGLDYPHLVYAVVSGSGDGVRALFWAVQRRDNPELKFADYPGPPMRIWRQLLPHFAVLADSLGKATEQADAALAASGTAGSPSSTATPPARSKR